MIWILSRMWKWSGVKWKNSVDVDLMILMMILTEFVLYFIFCCSVFCARTHTNMTTRYYDTRNWNTYIYHINASADETFFLTYYYTQITKLHYLCALCTLYLNCYTFNESLILRYPIQLRCERQYNDKYRWITIKRLRQLPT